MSTPTGDIKAPVLPTGTNLPSQPLYHQSYPVYTTYDPRGQYVPLQPERRKRGPVRRFLCALLFAGVTFVLIKTFVNLFRRHGHWHWNGGYDLIYDSEWYYDVPSDLTLQDCVPGEDWEDIDPSHDRNPYASAITFQVPLSEGLFLLSRGQLSGGSVQVTTSPTQATDSATIKVVAKYYRKAVRDLAKACLSSRREGVNGVGIFTPTWKYGSRPRQREDTMYFQTYVTLPEGSDDSSPLAIKHFETDVPNTVQALGALYNIFFDSITLKGTNGPIGAESLPSSKAVLRTTNGPITGHFNTTSSLIISTTNSPIQIAVGLESQKGELASLLARTTNGPLQAELSLSSTSGSGGDFDITTTTTNSPLTVGFPVAPVGSVLKLQSSTTNGPAKVFLHPTYEGKFDLWTSVFKGEVKVNNDVVDPSGKDRKRQVSFTTVARRQVVGKVAWVEDGKTEYPGAVSVRTTNSPLVLDL